jgi:hypothetical protein
MSAELIKKEAKLAKLLRKMDKLDGELRVQMSTRVVQLDSRELEAGRAHRDWLKHQRPYVKNIQQSLKSNEALIYLDFVSFYNSTGASVEDLILSLYYNDLQWNYPPEVH